MTFEVVAPGPSVAIHTPVVHKLFMAVQPSLATTQLEL